MSSANAQALKTMISVHMNTAYPDTVPTEAEFEEKATVVRNTLKELHPVSDDEFFNIKRALMANIIVEMDIGVCIKDSRPHQSWLPARRASLNFFFWKRYQQYLEEIKGWNSRVIANLGRVSDEIVDLLGDPKSETPFQRRGLVLGDVQSGKTANYTAICNKAADTGYRVIIVLTGMLESLRTQTQERLDTEFTGRDSRYLLTPTRENANRYVGVGLHGQDHRIETFTSVLSDFNKNLLKNLNLSLNSVTSTVLFVVKKNKSNLNNLIRWIKNAAPSQTAQINLSLLLIDDEADNASINTKKDDEDPTAINDAIRKLLKSFYQASYVGITATPYANIFINPDTTDEMRSDDLFPRDFIYSLEVPTNYIGAGAIFGESAPHGVALQEVSPTEMDSYFPFKHTKDHKVSELPQSMNEAIAYFILINAIQDARGDSATHRSMMIHVSRFTKVQNQIRDIVIDRVNQMRSALKNYAGLSEKQSSEIAEIAYFKSVWIKHGLAEKMANRGKKLSWHQFLTKYLYEAVGPVEVRAVNQESGATSLDYFNHKTDGLRVIAIGGNSLSRGLTLEGLSVSYFYRKSQMYDTLLQMGRWFGYRPGYDDLFKVWMSVDAIDWYGYITEVAEELKREISKMKNANKTPMEFGLKVRQDPVALLVTARNKMRAAEEVSRPVIVSGRLLETPRLRADKAILQANEEIFKDFVSKLDEIGERNPEHWPLFWSNVHKDEVAQLLRDFETHAWHLAFQGKALADYIQEDEKLDVWDIVIAEGSSNKTFALLCGEEHLSIKPEKRAINATSEQISISGTKVRVGSGGATRRGLTEAQRELAEENFKAANVGKKITQFPDSAYLAVQRPPILFLHVIEVDKAPDKDTGKPKSQVAENCQVPNHLFALGVGIPGSGELKTANYMVNMVELRNFLDPVEDEDA